MINDLLLFSQAIKEFGDVDVYTANFRPLKATISGLPDRVFMKLIVCAKTSKVLGLHMCGDDAPEIVQVAISFNSLVQSSQIDYRIYVGNVFLSL